jgi:hypothetical protein
MKLKFKIADPPPSIPSIVTLSQSQNGERSSNLSTSHRRKIESSKIFDEFQPKRSISPHIRENVDQIHLNRSSYFQNSKNTSKKNESYVSKSYSSLTEEKEKDEFSSAFMEFKYIKRKKNEIESGNPVGKLIILLFFIIEHVY